MKLVLIMLVAIAAVALGASIEIGRNRRDSGVDVDGSRSSVMGMGHDVAAETVAVEEKGVKGTAGAASASDGIVVSNSGIYSVKARKYE